MKTTKTFTWIFIAVAAVALYFIFIKKTGSVASGGSAGGAAGDHTTTQ